MLRQALQSNESSLTGLCSKCQEGGESNGQVVSIKRVDDGRLYRRREIVDVEREKNRAKNESFRKTSTDSKAATCLI